jgi:ribosomal-protein-alanine N-acetyltransferase
VLFRVLETARLRLEPIRGDHADAMVEGLGDPALYAFALDETPAGRDELRERYERLASGWSPDGDEHWLNWIVVPCAGAGAAGYVQATVARDRSTAVIGYLVLSAFQRRGIGGEAVGAMVDHLVAAGIGTLRAVVDVRNAASIALLDRLGFERRRTMRSDDVLAGVRGFDHEYVLGAHRLKRSEADGSP